MFVDFFSLSNISHFSSDLNFFLKELSSHSSFRLIFEDSYMSFYFADGFRFDRCDNLINFFDTNDNFVFSLFFVSDKYIFSRGYLGDFPFYFIKMKKYSNRFLK